MSNVVKVVAQEDRTDRTELNLRGFQSKAAKEAASVKKNEEAEVKDEVALAEVGADPVVAVSITDDSFKLVKVRARENIINMRVGNKTYNLYANKEAYVPKHIQVHLEERNLV